jgi:hypothetical protein
MEARGVSLRQEVCVCERFWKMMMDENNQKEEYGILRLVLKCHKMTYGADDNV